MSTNNNDSNIPDYSYVEDQKTVYNSFVNPDSSYITVTQKQEIPDNIPYKVLTKNSQNSYQVISPFGTVISNEQQIKTAKKEFSSALIEQSQCKKILQDQKKQYFPMKRFYNGLGRIKPELLNNKILDKIYSKTQNESEKKFAITDVSSLEYKNSIPGNSNQALTRRQITFSQQSKTSVFKHRSFAQRPTGPTSSLLSDSAQEFGGFYSKIQQQKRQQFLQNYPVSDLKQQNNNQSQLFIQQRNSEPRNEYTTAKNFKFSDNRTSLPQINQNNQRNAIMTVVSKLPDEGNIRNMREDFRYSNNISTKDQDSNLVTNNSQFSMIKNKEHRTISSYVANQRQLPDNTHSRQFESAAYQNKQSEPALSQHFQQNPKDNFTLDMQEQIIHSDQDIVLQLNPIRFNNKVNSQNSGQVGSLSVKVSQRKFLREKTEQNENKFNSFFVKVSIGSRQFKSHDKDINVKQNESVSFPISYYGKDKVTIQNKQKEKKIKNINSLENMPELVDEAAISTIIKKVENLPQYQLSQDRNQQISVDQKLFALQRNSNQESFHENNQMSDKEYFKKLMALLPQKYSQFFQAQEEVCQNWNQLQDMPQQFWDEFTQLQKKKRKLDMNQQLRNEMKNYALQRSQSVPRLYTKLMEPMIQTEDSTKFDKIDVTINQRDLGRIKSDGDFFRSKTRSQTDIFNVNNFINFSSGNQYDEQQNQKLKKAVNKIQNDIANFDAFIDQKEERVGEIFKQMKILKSKIIKTQLEGEKQGHCKGIQKKLDPIQKYKIIQDIGKHMRDQEEIREKNKQKKGIRQAQKQEQKKQRVLSNMHQKQIYKMLNCTSNINQNLPQNRKQIQMALLKSPTHQIINLELQTQREAILHKKKIQRNSSYPISPLQIQKKLTMNLNSSSFSSEIAEKRFKILRNALSFQQRWLKNYQTFDLLLSSKQPETLREKNVQSCLHTLIHHFEIMGFGPAKTKGLSNANNQNKACPILNDVNTLGLIQIPQFTKFFMSLCEEQVSIKNCRLRRQSLKDYLGIRYSARIADKILLFLENQFQSLYRINIEAYCKLIMDIMNAGPEFYKKLLFACLSFQNPGRICEHDLFNLLSQFQQAEPFHFYKQLIGKEDVPRDYLQIYDTSDRIFFEAFSPDFKIIAEQFEFRLKIQGIDENEKDQSMNKVKPDTKLNLKLLGKDNLQKPDDKHKQNNETQNNNEKIQNIANQIQYTAQLITNKGTSETFSENLFEILQNSQSLEELHVGLIKILAENKLIQKRDKKSGDSSDINDKKMNNGENGSRNTTQQSGISFLKPPTNIIPCLGHGINSLTGKKLSNCIYMNYEDFNKLIQFPKSQVSSFVEDLVDHMTCGLISLHSFEFYFHKYRTITNHNGFQHQNLLDFIKDRNTQIFGNPRGELSNAMIAKKSRQGLLEYQSFKHEVKQKFVVQDHFNNDEFAGKLLICNVTNNTSNNNQKKKTQKDKKSTMFATETIFGKKQNQIENKVQDENLYTDPDSLIDYGDQELKEIDNNDGDEIQQNDEEEEIKNRIKPIINLVDRKEVDELINLRQNFGNINFFRIFRIFYKLAVIPRDANNNPMSPYIDKKSIIRNFHKVFDIENEEIAVRFFSLFKQSEPAEEFLKDENKIKTNEIGIVQFMKVIWQLVNLGDNKHIQMAFKFLDYHNFSNVGSVDVMAITKCFDAQLVDDIKVNFKNKDNNY